MAIRTIRTRKDSVLREKALPVKKFGAWLTRLLDDMVETTKVSQGVGIAAPQIGISKRIIIVLDEEKELRLINPEIISTEGEAEGVEGCLSIPELLGKVKRAEKVVVKAFDEHGKEVTINAEGFTARVLQHEIDHLDGILFIDKAIEVYDNNTEDKTEGIEEIN